MDEKSQVIADCDVLVDRVQGSSEAMAERLMAAAEAQDEAGLRSVVEDAAKVGTEVSALDARLNALLEGVGPVGRGGGA